MRTRQRQAGQRLRRGEKEIKVLEGRERGEVEGDADMQHAGTARPLVPTGDQPSRADLPNQERDEPRVPPAGEDERCDDQRSVPRALRADHGVVRGDRERQEDQDETLRLEEHATGASPAAGYVPAMGEIPPPINLPAELPAG